MQCKQCHKRLLKLDALAKQRARDGEEEEQEEGDGGRWAAYAAEVDDRVQIARRPNGRPYGACVGRMGGSMHAWHAWQ